MPRTKPTLQPIVQLPDHIQLTERELSLVARLIRATRNDYSYLGLVIEYLLFYDANNNKMSIEEMEKILLDVKNLRNWNNFTHELIDRRPQLSEYAGLLSGNTDYDPEKVCGDFSDDDEFKELVTIWRRDHPEPEPENPARRKLSKLFGNKEPD